MIWLGDTRGYLSDWVTQQWVRATGRRVALDDLRWLSGPSGHTRQIGKQYFSDYAKKQNLEPVQESPRGLIAHFDDLGPAFVSTKTPVKEFYERTSEYELDAWSEWCGIFRLFGAALAAIFSRRLQQLNVPLSSLDTSRGISSEVLQWRDPLSGKVALTAWVRELIGSRNVLYAGSYSICNVPGHPSPCVKVAFPLPNGRAIVLMRPQLHADGSFSVISDGQSFGDPGFYFVVEGLGNTAWARYVRNLKETIHVYVAESGDVRADHMLRLWGLEFLRLHYRLQKIAERKTKTSVTDRALASQ